MKLRLAKYKDWKTLLEWRNDVCTRQSSITTEEVKVEDHKKWLKNSIASDKRIIYIGEEGGRLIGTIRVDIRGRTKELSWTISPTERRCGYGKKLLQKFVRNFPDSYMAQIKDNNIASIKMVESLGFILNESSAGILTYKGNK